MRRNILVADDDKHIQELIKLFLEQSGYTVRICSDGFSVKDELLRNYFDLVILDIFMPFGNGLKILSDIRMDGKLKDLPVLILTMSSDTKHISKAKSLGVSDYIIKPPQRDDLINRVSRILGTRPQFEEVQWVNGSEIRVNAIIPLKLKSISNVGVVLESDFPLTPGETFSFAQFDLLEKLNMSLSNYKLAQCSKTRDSKYEYFISFMNLPIEQQGSLREWIMTETFKRKKT